MSAQKSAEIGIARFLRSFCKNYVQFAQRKNSFSCLTNPFPCDIIIKLSANASQSDEAVIGSYFHVLNDVERIGDHAENFYEIGEEMLGKKLEFSEKARGDIKKMRDITRRDQGINGDAQRIEQLTWMLFLKIYDDKEYDWEAMDEDYESIIPEECRWRSWADTVNGTADVTA